MDVSSLLDTVYLLILGMPRFAIALLFLPAMSSRMLGGSMVRNAVLIAFAIFIYPVVSFQLEDVSLDRLSMLKIMSQEVIIGAFYGFFIGLPFVLVNTLGGVIDLQRGAMMSSVFNPGLGSTSTETSVFLNTVFSYGFFSAGPFLLSVAIILKSYVQIPLSLENLVWSGGVLKLLSSSFDGAMLGAVTFIAPITMVIFLIDFGLGLINRFTPAMNVFMLSLPIKSWVAVGMMLILLSVMIGNFTEYTKKSLSVLEDAWKVIVDDS